MINIDGVFLPGNLLTVRFCCRYGACGGACCVVGDQGAPLEVKEIKRISHYIPAILPHMDSETADHVSLSGFYVKDEHGAFTACLNGTGRCVFTVLNPEGGVSCVLEPVSRRLRLKTLRPVSCRLFPLRIRTFSGMEIIDYESWEECRSAWNRNTCVLDFCKQALIDRFGRHWVNKLDAYRLRFLKNIG